ncbi:hypothetical protein JTB14_021868 [Gonioctena quinquepunctata]|nr:hypothetical protein JTB14_021868 [Gonioctena quinquepunctata]
MSTNEVVIRSRLIHLAFYGVFLPPLRAAGDPATGPLPAIPAAQLAASAPSACVTGCNFRNSNSDASAISRAAHVGHHSDIDGDGEPSRDVDLDQHNGHIDRRYDRSTGQFESVESNDSRLRRDYGSPNFGNSSNGVRFQSDHR